MMGASIEVEEVKAVTVCPRETREFTRADTTGQA